MILKRFWVDFVIFGNEVTEKNAYLDHGVLSRRLRFWNQKKLFFACFLQFWGTYSALIDPPVIPVEATTNAGVSRNFQVEIFFKNMVLGAKKLRFWAPNLEL